MRVTFYAVLSTILTLVLLSASAAPGLAQTPAAVADEYTDKIKPIFDGRCVACHSCTNAPCQLNLQTWSGAARGATSLNVYDSKRSRSVLPTRNDIDASTPAEWRAKGFHDVIGAGTTAAGAASEPGRSLLLDLTRLRASHPTAQPRKQIGRASCRERV